MYSICFTIAGVIFSILLFIIYSLKTNFNISENKIYHSIIITTIITGLIEIYAFILVRNNIPENSNLYLFALKFLFLGFVTWLYLFTLYTVIVTLKLKDKDNDKCRIILVISSIIFTILSIITITLPISINKVGDLLLPTGSGVEVIYLLAVLCFVIMIIAIISNHRELKNKKYDGMIITGAPVEQIPFEEVDYWPELCEIMDWAKTHVTSTFHICWGAQAGLYYHYGLKKVLLPKKLFGVYHHKVMNRKNPLVRGFDDYFLIPHSRHTAVLSEDIHQCKELTVLAESEEAGVLLCMSEGGKEIYVMGHPEYDRYTLHKEYVRDKEKGLPIDVPKNYYPEDDDTQKPCLEWRAHCNILYSNWLNYFVYQITPYEL